MLKKIDRSALFLQENQHLFRCPLCHESMTAHDTSLICQQEHRFDLSKKGTLYFLQHQIQSEYDRSLFEARGRMIASGMYNPLLETIASYLPQKIDSLVDVGCGEGSFLNQLGEKHSLGAAIGFDIAKEGIYLATNQPLNAFWCVADLTNLPFQTEQVDVILNLFSPSHYQEFRRVLKPAGKIIKVVPEEGYLKELRQAYGQKSYQNTAVLERFQAELNLVHSERIQYTFSIPPERRLDIMEMSPLEWQATPLQKEKLQNSPLTEITIDLRILVGDIKRLH